MTFAHGSGLVLAYRHLHPPASAPPLSHPLHSTEQSLLARSASSFCFLPAIMRLSALLLSVVLSAAVPASSWLSQIPLSDEFAVPGENPLFFCADPADNILEIKTVNLSPNPPEA